MNARRQQPDPRPKRKTPAERAVEFDAEQVRLKSEAAERRKVADKKRAEGKPKGK